MTKDELRKHCEKTVETQLRYKNSTNGLEQFHSKKVLSEHQLILELLNNERPKGEWIEEIDFGNVPHYICPFCDERRNGKPNFCPKCGADMRGDR